MSRAATTTTPTETGRKPWPALWALVIGFFMILVDSTIVSVANPAILRDLQTDITSVIWVTSAYLLAYATPLLITGRLGDRFGPRRIYLIGLAIFTAASAWCGLSHSIEMLIIARVAQGLGAALMTPQTMSVITRIFPPDQRGTAMGLWGAVAGVATLIGPLAGGVLVDGLGWEWIFFVNVPVGVVAFVLALRLVPDLPTSARRFDGLGVGLSAIGLFLLIFGLQEGETYDWGTITGPISVPLLIILGFVVLVAFVLWQRFNTAEPLLPLGLFADRNFALSNTAITLVGLAVTAMPLPILFYFQVGRGLDPTQSALMMSPIAVASLIMAPIVGRLVDRINPRWIAVTGFVLSAVALAWMSAWMTPDRPYGWLLLPPLLLGIGMSGIWSPLAATATRNLPVTQAGAGSGVYNTARQVGAVVGSAAIAALINARLAVELPGAAAGAEVGAAGALPPAAVAGFSAAMSQALLLPAAVLAVGVIAVACFERPQQRVAWGSQPAPEHEPATGP